jgi:hypothetical protein
VQHKGGRGGVRLTARPGRGGTGSSSAGVGEQRDRGGGGDGEMAGGLARV